MQNGVDERERAGRQRFRCFVGEHEENAAIAAIQCVGLLQTRHQQRNERLPTADNRNSESVLLDQDGNAAHEERSERLGDFGREMNDGIEEREEFVDGRNDVVVDAGVDEVENALDDGFELEIEERAGLNGAGEEREDVVLENVDAFDVGFEQSGEEFDHEYASVHAGSGGNEMFSLEFALFQLYESTKSREKRTVGRLSEFDRGFDDDEERVVGPLDGRREQSVQLALLDAFQNRFDALDLVWSQLELNRIERRFVEV